MADRPFALAGSTTRIDHGRVTDAIDGLRPHPDRLLPAGSELREVSRRLYDITRDMQIISPHGHVDPNLLLTDEPFADPASLLISPDHYVTRLLHADGVDLSDIGVGADRLSEEEARRAWRILCDRWSVFAGTPVRMWLEEELSGIFGVTEVPSATCADRIYDHIADRLTRPEYRPRALYERFRIDVLAVTCDPCDDLAAVAALRDDPSWTGRVIPTFRPDRYLEPGPRWRSLTDRLGEAASIDTGDYGGYLAALEQRRRSFVDHGATSSDHSHPDVASDPLPASEAARIYRSARAGEASAAEAVAFRRHMLAEMARMSCEDGLVMTLHPGVRRNHHSPTLAAFGPDSGHDIPIRIDFTDALRPLLERYGTHPGFHLVVFTLDESTWSRELAPLAGFYPSVFIGVPWWFLDAPDSMRRFREAVTETAGFHRTSGFVDDTRAFCSIPARHDMARRIDAGFLAGLVCEHRLPEGEAADIAVRLVADQPRRVFKL